VAEADRPVLIGVLVANLFPDIPHPILGLFGEQGTGKSTAAKVLSRILDPSPAQLRKAPKDAEAWVTAASGSWVVALDNLSSVPDWLSDSLCRAATGDGDVRRKLYTDGELAVFAFRRSVIVTGIDLGALNGDLGDRLVPVTLDLLDSCDRVEDSELSGAFTVAQPRLLGAVCTLASEVLRAFPSVGRDDLPRMADFGVVLRALDGIRGTQSLDRYCRMVQAVSTDALSGDAFMTELQGYLGPGGEFEGTAAQLLADVLAKLKLVDDRWRPPKGWPASGRSVTVQLHRQAPAMRRAGWDVTDLGSNYHDNVTHWRIVVPQEVGK
jgi:hypothetical protein